ncbi:MAG: hypothetical protein Q7K16_02635, partial [Candidatus Azambacteria bacterium]|nr:hypothetical protein [Candidatus Azambacteria bacterium]
VGINEFNQIPKIAWVPEKIKRERKNLKNHEPARLNLVTTNIRTATKAAKIKKSVTEKLFQSNGLTEITSGKNFQAA